MQGSLRSKHRLCLLPGMFMRPLVETFVYGWFNHPGKLWSYFIREFGYIWLCLDWRIPFKSFSNKVFIVLRLSLIRDMPKFMRCYILNMQIPKRRPLIKNDTKVCVFENVLLNRFLITKSFFCTFLEGLTTIFVLWFV